MKHLPDMMLDCNKCEHYYITWDKSHPYGCRSMGFKSRELPSSAVLKNSGIDCLQYKVKTNNKKVKRVYTRAKLI